MLSYTNNKRATMDKFRTAAQENVFRYLADAVEDHEDEIAVKDGIYLLAHDGAVDAGATMDQATEIATQLAGY
jgi:hypothetical protein